MMLVFLLLVFSFSPASKIFFITRQDLGLASVALAGALASGRAFSNSWLCGFPGLAHRPVRLSALARTRELDSRAAPPGSAAPAGGGEDGAPPHPHPGGAAPARLPPRGTDLQRGRLRTRPASFIAPQPQLFCVSRPANFIFRIIQDRDRGGEAVRLMHNLFSTNWLKVELFPPGQKPCSSTNSLCRCPGSWAPCTESSGPLCGGYRLP